MDIPDFGDKPLEETFSSNINIPKLTPPTRKSNTSPTKRNNNNNTTSLISDSTFSLLDDFQNGDNNETIDLFSAPSLMPPSSLNSNDNIDPSKLKPQNRGIFSFEIGSSSSSSLSSKTNTPSDANTSIFSMLPTISSNTFDFGSYLRSVTSTFQIKPTIPDNTTSINKSLLDFSNPVKVDLLRADDQNLLDDLELDCVVRASHWESDVESDDDLELDLSSDGTKDVGSDNNMNMNMNMNKVRFTHNQNENDYLKYFNQAKTNNNNISSNTSKVSFNFDSKHSSNIPSQIPYLCDPLNSAITAKSDSRHSSPIANDNLNINTNSSIPLKIYSDNIFSPRNNSPTSSQGSDKTLTENFNSIKGTTQTIIKQDNSKCLPHHHIFAENLKSAFKPIPKTLLNLIVESSDGSLEDATKYATEINSQNSEGIPIPEKTTELVNIPTAAPDINGVRKSAIIRGVRARTDIKKPKNKLSTRKNNNSEFSTKINQTNTFANNNNNNNDIIANREKRVIFNTLGERRRALNSESSNTQNIRANNHIDTSFKGFYSLQEKQQFYKRNIQNNNNSKLYEKENYSFNDDSNTITKSFPTAFKRARVNETYNTVYDDNGKKKVNWADTLEW